MRIDNFVVDNAGLAENAATFYWSWDVNNDAQLHGKFRGFKVFCNTNNVYTRQKSVYHN